MPTHTLPDTLRQLVIIGIGSCLIQKTYGFLVQLHEVSLECQITNPRHVFLASSPIILHKQCQSPCCTEESPLNWVFLYLITLSNGKSLCRMEGRGSFEIDVIFITENFYC